MYKDHIAISCRFPGGINRADALWKLLVEDRDAVSDVPLDTVYSTPLVVTFTRMSPKCNTPPVQALPCSLAMLFELSTHKTL